MSSSADLLLSDINYSAWADERLLEAGSSLSIAELEQDLRLSHTSILATLRHIYDGERVWLDGIRNTPDGGIYVLPQGTAPELSIDALKQRWPKLWDGYRQWIGENSQLDSEIIVQLPGLAPRFLRRNILRHALDHSQFHRGQIVAMFRVLGHCPPAINRMDYLLA
ncbi:MAG TPA: DinB family protein [Terriglobales bacterium]|nr:DinB family protein [Terriglobales bacterium]